VSDRGVHGSLPRKRPGGFTLPAVSLLTDLDAFFAEHQRCGELDAGVDGPVVWIVCPCGASMVRRADDDTRSAVA
jgi:hypothetical protein